MPAEQQPILADQVEVDAAFLEYDDHHTGRLVDALEELDILDDTLIDFIIGDNGRRRLGPRHAHARPSGPKQVPSHDGGTCNGSIVHWPSTITGKGEVRNR